MTEWTNPSLRLASSAAFLSFVLSLAVTRGDVDGGQDSLLPSPPIPSYVPIVQAPPTHNSRPTLNALPADNPRTSADRQNPMFPALSRETQKSALPSFPIRPSRNSGPARMAADASASPTTEIGQQPGAAGPAAANPAEVPVQPTVVGPIGNARTAEHDATTMQGITQQRLDSLRVPREVQLRARKMLATGKRLAERGALFSARQEFLGVLQLIAQSYDAQLGKRFHTPALANGLRALREAGDFVTHRIDYDVDLQLEGLVVGHQTMVLKNTMLADLTPFVAMQRYYEYASDQLAIAGNREPTASEALYAIGRAEAAMAAKSQSKLGGPKPLAFYQAALVVDQSNSAAANELGVLLARAGKLEQAANVLQHASLIRATPTLVKNLNAVNQRLHGVEDPSPLDLPPSQPTPETLAQRVQVQWLTPKEYSRQIGPSTPMMSQNVNLPRPVSPHYSSLAPNRPYSPITTR